MSGLWVFLDHQVELKKRRRTRFKRQFNIIKYPVVIHYLGGIWALETQLLSITGLRSDMFIQIPKEQWQEHQNSWVFADSAKAEYCSNFHCVRVCVISVLLHIALYKVLDYIYIFQKHRPDKTRPDQDATRIKVQRGSRCNEDQDTTRIKIQRGSRCNEDQYAPRI